MLIDHGYNTTFNEHNFKLENGKYADITIISDKIIVEYDGWRYHAHKLNSDIKRYREFQKLGWKVLGVRSKRSLPKIETINKKIEKLMNCSNYEVITCKDWYKPDRKSNRPIDRKGVLF